MIKKYSVLHKANTNFYLTLNKIVDAIVDANPYEWVYLNRDKKIELFREIQDFLIPVEADIEKRKEIATKILQRYVDRIVKISDAIVRENPEAVSKKTIFSIVERVILNTGFGSHFYEEILQFPFTEQKHKWLKRIDDILYSHMNMLNDFYFFPRYYDSSELRNLSVSEKVDLFLDAFQRLENGENMIEEKYPTYQNMSAFRDTYHALHSVVEDALLYQGMSKEEIEMFFKGKPETTLLIEIDYFYHDLEQTPPEKEQAFRTKYR